MLFCGLRRILSAMVNDEKTFAYIFLALIETTADHANGEGLRLVTAKGGCLEKVTSIALIIAKNFFFTILSDVGERSGVGSCGEKSQTCHDACSHNNHRLTHFISQRSAPSANK
jgi:hypothetical protein